MSSNDEIERLDAALTALDRFNISDWPDWALSDSLDELSRVLCRIDSEVARLAESVRARGFAIHEPSAGPRSVELTLAEFTGSGFVPTGFVPTDFAPADFGPADFGPAEFVPAEFVPAEFVPAEYVPAEFVPGEFAPAEFSLAEVAMTDALVPRQLDRRAAA